jgi:hypothetical protein
MDATRRRWLETIATGCERVISDLGRDPHEHARLVADIEELLARLFSRIAGTRTQVPSPRISPTRAVRRSETARPLGHRMEMNLVRRPALRACKPAFVVCFDATPSRRCTGYFNASPLVAGPPELSHRWHKDDYGMTAPLAVRLDARDPHRTDATSSRASAPAENFLQRLERPSRRLRRQHRRRKHGVEQHPCGPGDSKA